MDGNDAAGGRGRAVPRWESPAETSPVGIVPEGEMSKNLRVARARAGRSQARPGTAPPRGGRTRRFCSAAMTHLGHRRPAVSWRGPESDSEVSTPKIRLSRIAPDAKTRRSKATGTSRAARTRSWGNFGVRVLAPLSSRGLRGLSAVVASDSADAAGQGTSRKSNPLRQLSPVRRGTSRDGGCRALPAADSSAHLVAHARHADQHRPRLGGTRTTRRDSPESGEFTDLHASSRFSTAFHIL